MTDHERAQEILQEAERTLGGWLSVSAYARKYCISRHTIYKWMDGGAVTFYRVDRLVRIKDEPPRQNADAA